MPTEAERERLDHLEAIEHELSEQALPTGAEPTDITEFHNPFESIDHAVDSARDGDFGPMRQMVDDCDYTPEERAKQLTDLDRLEAARAAISRKVDIRLVRMVHDVLTAKCQVCKQTKEGLLFSDRRHSKIYFKDVFLCWDDFVMIAKKTKALGLFESKIASAYFYE